VYYYGDDPDGFMQKFKNAIASGNYDSIEDLLEVIGVTVTPVDKNKGGIVDSNSPESVVNDRIGSGAIVGILAAALFVVLILLLVARHRRRNRGSENACDIKNHSQLTEDEDDNYTIEIDTDSIRSAGDSPRVAHIIGEEDSLVSSWTEPADREKKIDFAPSDEEVWFFDRELDREMETSALRSIEEHYCESPHCGICEMKRQSGVRFQRIHSSGQRKSPRSSDSFLAPNTIAL